MHILFIFTEGHVPTHFKGSSKRCGYVFLFKPILLQIISIFFPPIFQSFCYVYKLEIKESPLPSSMYDLLANTPGWPTYGEAKNKVYMFLSKFLEHCGRRTWVKICSLKFLSP